MRATIALTPAESKRLIAKATVQKSEIKKAMDTAYIILCEGTSFSKYRSIRLSDKYLIIDIYDPYNLATLAEYQDESIEKRMEVYKSTHDSLNDQLYHGDFFICASERQ